MRLNFLNSFLCQFVFVYQRGMNTGGDVALDDITILPGPCYSEPPIAPTEDNNGNLKPPSSISTEHLSYVPTKLFIIVRYFIEDYKTRVVCVAVCVDSLTNYLQTTTCIKKMSPDKILTIYSTTQHLHFIEGFLDIFMSCSKLNHQPSQSISNANT